MTALAAIEQTIAITEYHESNIGTLGFNDHQGVVAA